METNQTETYRKLIDEIKVSMSRVLDDCELELGDSPRWKPFRSRMLKIFGDSGLQGKVADIMGQARANKPQ